MSDKSERRLSAPRVCHLEREGRRSRALPFAFVDYLTARGVRVGDLLERCDGEGTGRVAAVRVHLRDDQSVDLELVDGARWHLRDAAMLRLLERPAR
jgi:hypothetical protein